MRLSAFLHPTIKESSSLSGIEHLCIEGQGLKVSTDKQREDSTCQDGQLEGFEYAFQRVCSALRVRILGNNFQEWNDLVTLE